MPSSINAGWLSAVASSVVTTLRHPSRLKVGDWLLLPSLGMEYKMIFISLVWVVLMCLAIGYDDARHSRQEGKVVFSRTSWCKMVAIGIVFGVATHVFATMFHGNFFPSGAGGALWSALVGVVCIVAGESIGNSSRL